MANALRKDDLIGNLISIVRDGREEQRELFADEANAGRERVSEPARAKLFDHRIADITPEHLVDALMNTIVAINQQLAAARIDEDHHRVALGGLVQPVFAKELMGLVLDAEPARFREHDAQLRGRELLRSRDLRRQSVEFL